MTTNDGFLSRWSRRKAAQSQLPKEAARDEAAAAADAPELQLPELELPELELPDIGTLGSSSDYTAFLQKGVVADVQRRALQRAWESDAGIAAFRGMADYDWDFNAPSYGRLWATDNVAELLRAVLAPPPPPDPAPETEVDPGPAAVPEQETGPHPRAPALLASAPTDVLEEMVAEPVPRRHGSALPT